jgi:hypothetical protein
MTDVDRLGHWNLQKGREQVLQADAATPPAATSVDTAGISTSISTSVSAGVSAGVLRAEGLSGQARSARQARRRPVEEASLVEQARRAHEQLWW